MKGDAKDPADIYDTEFGKLDIIADNLLKNSNEDYGGKDPDVYYYDLISKIIPVGAVLTPDKCRELSYACTDDRAKSLAGKRRALVKRTTLIKSTAANDSKETYLQKLDKASAQIDTKEADKNTTRKIARGNHG